MSVVSLDDYKKNKEKAILNEGSARRAEKELFRIRNRAISIRMRLLVTEDEKEIYDLKESLEKIEKQIQRLQELVNDYIEGKI